MGSCCGKQKIQKLNEEEFIQLKTKQILAIKKTSPELHFSNNGLLQRRKEMKSNKKEKQEIIKDDKIQVKEFVKEQQTDQLTKQKNDNSPITYQETQTGNTEKTTIKTSYPIDESIQIKKLQRKDLLQLVKGKKEKKSFKNKI